MVLDHQVQNEGPRSELQASTMLVSQSTDGDTLGRDGYGPPQIYLADGDKETQEASAVDSDHVPGEDVYKKPMEESELCFLLQTRTVRLFLTFLLFLYVQRMMKNRERTIITFS